MREVVQRRVAEGLRMPVTLVTGPVRSGKSRFVLQLAASAAAPVRFVATALRDAHDAEWNERIARHMRDRPAAWETVESAAIGREALLDVFNKSAVGECIVVDALGTWLAARMAMQVEAFENDYARFERQMDAEAAELAAAMLAARAQVIVVAEEVGWDVVPAAASARLFRDVLGRMKQRLAAQAERAFLIVCGFALDLRALGISIDA